MAMKIYVAPDAKLKRVLFCGTTLNSQSECSNKLAWLNFTHKIASQKSPFKALELR